MCTSVHFRVLQVCQNPVSVTVAGTRQPNSSHYVLKGSFDRQLFDFAIPKDFNMPVEPLTIDYLEFYDEDAYWSGGLMNHTDSQFMTRSGYKVRWFINGK